MFLIASLSALIFVLLSILHLYWLFGGKWAMDSVIPTKDKTSDKIFSPSPLSTVVVAIGLLGFGLIALGGTGLFSDGVELKYFRWGNLFIAFIFLARAVGDFNYVGFFKKIRNTRFAKNDSRYYSPLCLFLGIASILIVLSE